MKKFVILGILVITWLLAWPYLAPSADKRYKSELRNNGVEVSRVWTGKLTSGENFVYVYVNKLDSVTVAKTLQYLADQPELIDASLEITHIRGKKRDHLKDYQVTGIVGTTAYLQPLHNFMTLLEEYRLHLNSAIYNDQGYFASAFVDEQGNRIPGEHDMWFTISADTPKQTTINFMATLWDMEDVHRYTTVGYGKETLHASSHNGSTNNLVLRPDELELYKERIIKQINDM